MPRGPGERVTNSHRLTAQVVLALVLVVACEESDIRPECPGAAVVDAEGIRHCVYGRAHLDRVGSGFRCPATVPSRIELADGWIVCAERFTPACELAKAVCDVAGGSCCRDAGPIPGEPDAASDDAFVDPPDAGMTDDAGEPDAGPTLCTQTVSLTGPELVQDSILFGGACGTDQRMNANDAGGLQVAYSPWSCFWLTHSVLRVDVSAIPSEARVLAASLRLYVIGECSVGSGEPDNCGSFDGRWNVTINPLRRAWHAPEVDWIDAADGERWSLPGALDPTADHLAFPEHTLSLLAGEAAVHVEADVTASVAGHVDGTLDNHGWLLRGPRLPRPSSRVLDVASSEASLPEQRPVLEVTYEGPCN